MRSPCGLQDELTWSVALVHSRVSIKVFAQLVCTDDLREERNIGGLGPI